MVRTVITPQKSTYPLAIPPHYIGKMVEVLIYSNDDFVEYKEPKKQKPSDFLGTLSVAEGEKFHQYVKQSREIIPCLPET
ncbi:MAG: hypothetical protein LBR64_08195 [Dysgonamonadaceae bacterium]|jgi:hypothetical protein|nr:hypothetical protein [Dysgonamonadaceae bacterium]